MQITKLGHCCLLIETNGKRILTDPGTYSTKQNEVRNIDLILITHEHADHLHVESLQTVLKNNPKAHIVTNASVGKILSEQKIAFEVCSDGMKTLFQNVPIEAIGKTHAKAYGDFPELENTGFWIAGRFFYPGDALTDPKRKIEILALPVAGPWIKLAEAIDYEKRVKPKVCFPVHDGMLKITGPFYFLPEKELTPLGVKFVVIKEGESQEF